MKQVKRPLLIAVTGGIASGKSVVLEELRLFDIPVYQADIIGHEILQLPETKEILANKFGTEIIDNNVINRVKLGLIIFASPEKRVLLNSIIHPIILQKMQTITDECKKKWLVFEVPLLFETGQEICFDFTIHVFCTESQQKQRLNARNNLSSEQIRQRIESQMNTEEKCKKADLSIENNGTLCELKNKIENIVNVLSKVTVRNVKRFDDFYGN
jgi:dephospho-CoA kinase